MEKLLLGKKIRGLRRDKGLMQYELAEKSFITAVTLCRIEYGLHKPTPATLKCIADALGVTLDELAGMKG